jgi:hypothetical protein
MHHGDLARRPAEADEAEFEPVPKSLGDRYRGPFNCAISGCFGLHVIVESQAFDVAVLARIGEFFSVPSASTSPAEIGVADAPPAGPSIRHLVS